MPDQEFPHLQLAYRGAYTPRFNSGQGANPEIAANRANRSGHAHKLRQAIDRLRQFYDGVPTERQDQGLPAIPADKGFLLRLPEGADVESIVKALGVELVAETDEGLMLVSTENLELAKLENVLKEFDAGTGSLVAGSTVLDIYERPDDPRRLQTILSPEVFALWPFREEAIFTFDLGIQTAHSTRSITWPGAKKRKSETNEQFLRRREELRRNAWIRAEEEWQDKASERVMELQQFTDHYGGTLVSPMISDPSVEDPKGITFPDSVQVRVKLSGKGFRDVCLNFSHLFEVTLPPEIQIQPSHDGVVEPHERLALMQPAADAPTVCIIDSGIQEEHVWLAPAMDSQASRCFLPGEPATQVSDFVRPRGHGTRVAGAVLYPREIPKSGEIQAVSWIQNARVLDANNTLPESLSPESYLQQVVAHFHTAPKYTKIYNHSINARVPCPRQRMTSWAAKIDQLSHEEEVLFIQSVGNQDRLDNGDSANPGLIALLASGKQPPDHQLELSMRVANPAQSLHAISVGSVSPEVFEDENYRSFAETEFGPSGFSRAGYGEPWSVVKPDVVEFGGDLVFTKNTPLLVRQHPEVAIELLNSTMHGEPAYSRDGTGTSFAAPKVAHIAAHLQNIFPATSPLLYRALIIQSAQWPSWTNQCPDKDKVLRLVGYGLPSRERATQNSSSRVTLITPDAVELPSKQFHLYTVSIPQELRNAAMDARIRIEITLAYTALPRRTRARRTGYLETWLDWECSRLGEPLDQFLLRMQQGGRSPFDNFPWTLHTRNDWGIVEQTSRNHGSVQKDWADFSAFELPEEFAIAVRSHMGWNHREGDGTARYCLVVSFQALDTEVPIYTLIESEIQVSEIEATGTPGTSL